MVRSNTIASMEEAGRRMLGHHLPRGNYASIPPPEQHQRSHSFGPRPGGYVPYQNQEHGRSYSSTGQEQGGGYNRNYNQGSRNYGQRNQDYSQNSRGYQQGQGHQSNQGYQSNQGHHSNQGHQSNQGNRPMNKYQNRSNVYSTYQGYQSQESNQPKTRNMGSITSQGYRPPNPQNQGYSSAEGSRDPRSKYSRDRRQHGRSWN